MSAAAITAGAVFVGTVAVAHRTLPTPTRPTRGSPPARRRLSLDMAYLDALDLLVLSIRAGLLPIEGLRTVLPQLRGEVHVAFRTVVEQVDAGARVADALSLLPALLGPRALLLADALAAADRDGLPLAPVLERLAADARAQRRRHADALARQLPVRMAFPLVLCVLPSFVLLAVAPMLIAALSALIR